MEIFELRERVEEIGGTAEAEAMVESLRTAIREIESDLQRSFEVSDLERFGEEAVRLKYYTKVFFEWKGVQCVIQYRFSRRLSGSETS